MNPEGVEWVVFNIPIVEAISPRWSISVMPLPGNSKLPIYDEYNILNTKKFAYVYYIWHTGKQNYYSRGLWSYFVKHQNGCYVYLKITYDENNEIFDTGYVWYSKSWNNIWTEALSKEEKAEIKTLPWYKSCERTRAALLALSVLQRNGLFARDLFRMVAERVWEKRFNN